MAESINVSFVTLASLLMAVDAITDMGNQLAQACRYREAALYYCQAWDMLACAPPMSEGVGKRMDDLGNLHYSALEQSHR